MHCEPSPSTAFFSSSPYSCLNGEEFIFFFSKEPHCCKTVRFPPPTPPKKNLLGGEVFVRLAFSIPWGSLLHGYLFWFLRLLSHKTNLASPSPSPQIPCFAVLPEKFGTGDFETFPGIIPLVFCQRAMLFIVPLVEKFPTTVLLSLPHI